MHLTNFHYYSFKNHLYSKPVKVLRGYEVGYGFSFNGKENDDETQTQDYGFRIYNNRLARFLSIDPITKSYPQLTPYQYASNRPIQCIDIDGLEAYFNNSGEFVKWGADVSKTAPVILLHNEKEIEIKLTVDQFKTRVYFLSGEGATEKQADYYAHVFKNAKSYGFHGKGFTEDKMLSVLWQDKKYKRAEFLAGLPEEKGTKNYQSYKDAFRKKDDFSLWDKGFKLRSAAILKTEAGLTEDPTRGATNWGGGIKNYNYYVKQFGKDNVVTLVEGKFRHNFFNINTGILTPIKKVESKAETPKPANFSTEPPKTY